eukprot:6455837-Amphidinium_carterae.1
MEVGSTPLNQTTNAADAASLVKAHTAGNRLQEQVEQDFGTTEAFVGVQRTSTAVSSNSALPSTEVGVVREVTLCEPVVEGGQARNSPGPHSSPCLPVVVSDEVRLCVLGCFCARHAHTRTIREQVVIACCDCITAHPKQVPETASSDLFGAATFNRPVGVKRHRERSPPRRDPEGEKRLSTQGVLCEWLWGK